MKIANRKPDSLLPGIPGRKEQRNPSKDSGWESYARLECYYLLYGENNRPEYLDIPTLFITPPKTVCVTVVYDASTFHARAACGHEECPACRPGVFRVRTSVLAHTSIPVCEPTINDLSI